MTREVHVVVPAGIDDLASPSGGNRYDRRVVQGLAATGWDVRERAVPGGWPRPDATARAGLATALAAMPDGAVVLVDGLVACGVPDVVVPRRAGSRSSCSCTCRSATRRGRRRSWRCASGRS
jgi:hypothetical protein